MNCRESIDRMDGLLDGRLDAAEAEELRSHLAGCASCSDELDALQTLRERIAELPSALEPGRDLWPGIEARIRNGNVVRGRFSRRALLAAAAAVLVISSVVTAYLVGRSQGVVTTAATSVAESGRSAVLQASFEGLGVTDFQLRRDELMDALEARRHELSPETMAVVMDNLSVIDRAMDEIAAALGDDPENELLMRKLAGAYRRQIDLLQRAVRLPTEV